MTTTRSGLWLLAALGCRPGPAVVVVEVNDQGPLEQSDLILGRDGGYSVAAWGRSVWTYGDTVLVEPDEEGQTWHTNSVSWTMDDDATDGLSGFVEPTDSTGAPAFFLPFTADEVAFIESHRDTDQARWALWPSATVFDVDRDRVLAFYGKVYAEPGAFNFEGVGQGLAIWEALDAEPVRPSADRVADHPTLMFDAASRMGDAAVVVGDLLYAYGCPGSRVKRCVLGRVPLEAALDRSAWRFHRNGDWVEDIDRAKPLFSAHDILSVHAHAGLDVFVAIYSKPLSNGVMLRTAPAPEGPWSEAVRVFDAEPADSGAAPYSALAHAEYDEPDAIWVTYFRETAPFAGELRLVRVGLQRR